MRSQTRWGTSRPVDARGLACVLVSDALARQPNHVLSPARLLLRSRHDGAHHDRGCGNLSRTHPRRARPPTASRGPYGRHVNCLIPPQRSGGADNGYASSVGAGRPKVLKGKFITLPSPRFRPSGPIPERPSGPVRNLTSRFRSPGLRSHFPKIAQCYTRRRVSPGVAAVRVAAVGVTGGSRASSFLRMCAGDRPVLDAAYILTLLDPLLSRRGGLDAFDG
jgi:hypothetical protein